MAVRIAPMSDELAGASPLLTYCVTAGTTTAARTAMTVTVTRISGSVKPRRTIFFIDNLLRGRLVDKRSCDTNDCKSNEQPNFGAKLNSVHRHDQELQRVDGADPVANGT